LASTTGYQQEPVQSRRDRPAKPHPAPATPPAPRLAPGKEPGSLSLGRSASRHVALLIVVTAIGLVAGIAIGFVHKVTYSAEATLVVGQTSGLPEAQLPGVATAVQSLAVDYADLITSSDVVDQAESTLHTKSLPGTLSAAAVPQSSVVHVTGSAPSRAQAIALADAGAQALVSAVADATNTSEAQLQPIIAAYEKYDSAYEAAQSQANLYSSQLASLENKAGSSPTAAEQSQEHALGDKLVAAQTQAATYQMEANAYLNQYNNASPPVQSQEETLREVGSAAYSGSNRKRYLEAGALGGLVGGVLIGLALASWVEIRGRRGPAKEATETP
jgi:Chain length determinant protein